MRIIIRYNSDNSFCFNNDDGNNNINNTVMRYKDAFYCYDTDTEGALTTIIRVFRGTHASKCSTIYTFRYLNVYRLYTTA